MFQAGWFHLKKIHNSGEKLATFKTDNVPSMLGETHFRQSKSLGIEESQSLDSHGGGAFKYHQQNHKQELG